LVLVLFHSIPSVSATEEFVCWLAGAVGGKVKISGIVLDVAMLVGAVFFAGGVFSFAFCWCCCPVVRFCLVRSVRSRFKYKFCWCRVMGVSVGEFAVVGMASFGLVWFEWLRGVQARDCGDSGVVFKQEIVEIVVCCARLWLAWCLVLVLFHSIPSVSAAEEFCFSQWPRMREGGVQKAVMTRGRC
jgi:hypothetical protein